MGRRGRKAIASIGILVFVIVYFYAAAGIGWGVPIIPLIRWANRS
jgi:hypothetical protein